ncbi:MAG TPA: low-specificity L-threonine aldolase [Anaerolineaceae bacterium]|nr:low-specificity L-threonine aldolase [Anaerolineaceae bacterium]HQN05595.1 low-specificity L-threonine aldolase [Anaerolineaceae bacterium]HQP08854.1 low-specificity L-threonine aldolase [Anaerolineaceae bacterium]
MIIDMRSDTVTVPTPAMRAAMANAEVGDDVYGEDPTVNRLEEVSAHMMGKEAGLFVPSGTMGNLTAVLTHCTRGDEAIMGHLGHTFLFEAGGVAALGGVMPHTIPNQPDGSLKLEDIQDAVRSEDVHYPPSRLVILENTHNRAGGTVLGVDYTAQVAEVAHRNGLKLHIDGARIFNAAAALGIEAEALVKDADSVTFCLSKALCAPVGSVLCGSGEFIHRARKLRKQLGGGMRQAGILAAAGIVALQEMVPLLPDDHRRAHLLAQGLKSVPSLVVETDPPQTNMVFTRLDDSSPLTGSELVMLAAEKGLRFGLVGERRFRLVLHHWIDDAAVVKAVDVLNSILNS